MTHPPTRKPFRARLAGSYGLAGRLTLSWALAGGLTMIAILVMAAFTSGNPRAAADPFTASAYFLAGALGGLIHGVLVGVAGRPQSIRPVQALRSIGAGIFWSIPCLLLGWLIGIWLSMTAVAVDPVVPWLLIGVALAWLATLVVVIWALLEARRGLRHALRRWPESRPGKVLVTLTFLILAVTFMWVRPEIWFTDLRPSALGAFFLAMGATIWMGLPVLVFLLHYLHRWRADSPIWGEARASGEL